MIYEVRERVADYLWGDVEYWKRKKGFILLIELGVYHRAILLLPTKMKRFLSLKDRVNLCRRYGRIAKL